MKIHGSSPAGGPRRHLSSSNDQLERTFSKLASGTRVTRASDDASGLSISERLRALIESDDAAERNVIDGTSALHAAEGTLEEASEVLERVREAAVQAADGTLSEEDRESLQLELDTLRDHFQEVTEEFEHAGIRFFDGTNETFTVHSGPNGADSIEIALDQVSVEEMGLDEVSFETPEEARDSLADIDSAIDRVSSVRSGFGAAQGQLTNALRSIGQNRESLARTESVLRDADMALELADLVQLRLLAQGATSVFTQANLSSANAQQLLAG